MLIKMTKSYQPLKPDLDLEEAVLGFNHNWLCENSVIDEKVMQQLVKKIRGVTRVWFSGIKTWLMYQKESLMDI